MKFPHPWRRLRSLGHVTLEWHEDGSRGRARHSTQTISLRRDLTQAERRSALAHEIEHLLGGPAVVGYVEQDERDTTRRASRWLIPFDLLAEAIVYAHDDHELAELLWVDVFTVRARLEGLTDRESEELERRMLAAERTFPA